MLAVAAVVMVSLSGCSLIGDGERVWGFVQEDFAKKDALTAVVEEIRTLDGVEEANWRFLGAGPNGGEADITVVADDDATVPQLLAAAELANETFAGEDLEPLMRLFMITDANGATLSQRAFGIGGEQLADEIGYWRAAGDSLGVGLSVTLTDAAEEPGYSREFTHSGDAADALLTAFVTNYDRLLAVSDDSTASSMWMVSGFMARGLPPAEVVTLLDDIRQVVPIRDPSRFPENPPADYVYPSGFMMGWATRAPWDPEGISVMIGQREYRASDWPDVVAAAALAAAVSPLEFMYQVAPPADDPTGHRMFRFFTGACNGAVEAGKDDHALVAALADVGTVLPEGGGAGMCMRTPPEQTEQSE
ncbi:hypothetical protein FB562_2546 [Homoserinimonas aerilata]|uniref:Uncharacterized protein n=2 Tax=Homoserinimonas aerilata TaxID=1162970 RepID=A0A542Y1L2_9MICO|nr:hypothetical protein FB562_2546 [Homoserinimonas aerilata]